MQDNRPLCQRLSRSIQSRDCYYHTGVANIAEAFSASSIASDPPISDWYLDTGASAHMTPTPAQLHSSTSYAGSDSVVVGNGPYYLSLILALHWENQHILAQGSRRDGLYVLDDTKSALVTARTPKASFELWHSRLGHVAFDLPNVNPDSAPQLSSCNLCDEPPLLSGLKSHTNQDEPTINTHELPAIPHETQSQPNQEESDINYQHANESSLDPIIEPAPQIEMNPPVPPPIEMNPIVPLPRVSSTHPMQTRSRAGIIKPKRKCSGIQMVFRAKFKADGSLDRYKARLVAQGFTQLPGFDYCHTFSPVVQASTIPVVLSIVVSNNWPLHQLDVQNAFLNDVLSKAIYMEQPPGFIDPQFPNHVCRLKKAIYGLKQASLAWYQRLNDLKSFISRLHQEFAITDLGKLGYFFGLEVTYTSSGIFLNQAKYARDILQRASLEESKPVSTPLVAGCQLSTDGQPFEDPTLYRSLVGLLQYLTITRPDLSFDVNLVSQHLQHPTIAHFQALSSCPTLYSYNNSAIFLSQNPSSHKRAKHIDIDFHFVRELVSNGQLETQFVSSDLQVVDILTKALHRPLFVFFRDKLRVRPHPMSCLRGDDSIK
ncbi:hypothetical protein SASPL_113661 [Salvia splendens]|uniref:Reverse transcriptase Ty1/copia-type domain-containing protein n=1 Tax=Salvia splendens TaxID=180675 RepID=A0A8X8XZA3_SALSN|nr:hypothetical protein SASPL_113661 [Salvia splendens]